MSIVSPETSPRGEVLLLYNPAYVTIYGTKDIAYFGHLARVHVTGNLPDLIDAWLHKKAGFDPEPDNTPAQLALAKLDDPTVQLALDNFGRHNPELTGFLADITARRHPGVGVKPLEQEQSYRDFIYSQALDHIGDLTWQEGLDLGRLVV